MKRKIHFTLLILFIASCNIKQSGPEANATNDTIEVLIRTFDTLINYNRLPDKSFLLSPEAFGDTIIVVKDSLTEKYLSQIKNVKLKLLSLNEICEMEYLFNRTNRLFLFPNFLEIKYFTKEDSGYKFVLVQSGVIANFDNEGHPRKLPTAALYDGKEKCSFIMSYTMYMIAVNKKDKFFVSRDGMEVN
jgi:hypothetical protein